ncbi:c-type cytochrome domain-containing protein [Prosthecobacter dejongeii]|uniref:c-type cytochrome domain-containing protein n=1 Tax=Prosthecobacter dejongeii TaxID=48465 RepID=UPI001C8432D9
MKLLPLLMLAAASHGMSAELDFYQDIYPFLKANCISCHNKTTTKADLDMETPEMMKKGGESGPSILPGKGAESLLVLASLHQNDLEMPPANNKSGAVNLTPKEVALLTQWINEGAKSSTQQQRTVSWQPLAAGVHPIYSVAVSQDGRYAACGRSNQIFVYDLATRQFITQITDPSLKDGTAHRAMVQSLAFSADGTRLASGSFREVKIWHLAPIPTTPLPAQAAQPINAALLKKLAEAAKTTFTCHTATADGKQIVTGCADGSVRVWDATTAKPVMELRGTVALAKKTAELNWAIAAQGLEQSFYKAETTKTEAQNKALDELLKKANEAIVSMKKVLPEKQKALKPATDAKAAAQKSVDDIQAQIAALPEGKADTVHAKQLKDAQEKLITATTAETSALSAISAAESNVKDAEEEVQRITTSKSKNATALTDANRAIETSKKIQDKASAELAALKQVKSTAKPLTLAFSSDNQRVAALFDDRTLRVWAVASGQPLAEDAAPSSPATTLVQAADGSFIASQTVQIHAGATPRWALERTLGGDKSSQVFADRVNALTFSPDGKTLATGGGELSRSGDILLFDVSTGQLTQSWKDRHEDAVLSLDFSPDGKHLASGASDKIAKVTEVTTGKQMNLFEGHTHHVMSVDFRADGRVLATAGADGVVMTWDMNLGERKKKIEGWTKEVTSLQYIGATNQLITAAGDNLVRVVTDEGVQVRSIANLPNFMQAAASTPSGALFIAGGEDSLLRLWDGATGKEMAAFGSKTP